MVAAPGRDGVAALARLTLPLVLSLTLAACAAGPGGASKPAAGQSSPGQSSSSAEKSGAGAEAQSGESESGQAQPGQTQSWPAPKGSAETAALPPQLSSPDRLKGMTGSDVASLLGPPMLVRRDEPGEVWQYVSQDCVLDLFLYGPEDYGANAAAGRSAKRKTADPAAGTAAAAKAAVDAGGNHTVVYYEIRDREGAPAASNACLSTLVAANRARPSG